MVIVLLKPAKAIGDEEELQCARPHFADVFSCKPLLHGS